MFRDHPRPGAVYQPTTYVRSQERSGYYARLKNHIAWSSFPVRVYFVRDGRYTAAREKATRIGMDRWVNATHRVVTYQVTVNAALAQITVRFDPSTNDGYTTTNFDGDHEITSAAMRVGVKRGWRSDIACIAAHEFGHALGLDGHSADRRDLMYPSHRMGSAWSITARDLDTLSAVYLQRSTRRTD